MPLGSITVHVATVIETDKSGDWIEGEQELEQVEGQVFDCFLQIPRGSESDRGRRETRRPLLLYESFDQDGADLVLRKEDRLSIVALELTGPDPVLWMVDGTPEPLARPGTLIGYQAQLTRIDD